MSLTVRDDIRLAGRVLRYHTWPHIRQQTVAEHTWQVLRILLVIWPEPSPQLVRYVVGHDVGEITVGDPPYPIKANNPVLKSEMDRLEGEAQDELFREWLLGDVPELTEDERWAFKMAEFIEMWEWGWEEELLGNRFASRVRERCESVVIDRTNEALYGGSSSPSVRHPTRGPVADRVQEYWRRRTRAWGEA